MIILIVSYVVGMLGYHWRTQKYDRQLKVLNPPKSLLWISISLTLSFIVAMLLVLFLADEYEALLGFFFIPMILLGIWLTLYSINWQIEIKEDSFIFRNMFGRKKEYGFDKITKVKRIKIGGFRIYINKKSITVDYWIKGVDNLWDIVKLLKTN